MALCRIFPNLNVDGMNRCATITSIALFEGDYTIRRTYKTSLHPILDGFQPQQENTTQELKVNIVWLHRDIFIDSFTNTPCNPTCK